MDNNKVLDMPMNCTDCGKSLVEGDIFYKHPEYGIVCESCPAFSDGGIDNGKD